MKNFLRHFVGCLLLLTCATNASAQHISVTVAGIGQRGYYGDGGPARMAKLKQNTDICVDRLQNVYFSDQNKRIVRKISGKTGAITTIAGGGTSSADGIPATSASLFIRGMCTDPTGDVYLLASNVKRIDIATNTIYTYAGGWHIYSRWRSGHRC